MGKIKILGNNKYLLQWDGNFPWCKPQQLMLEVKCNVPYKFSIDTINEKTRLNLPIFRMAFTVKKARNVKMKFICTPVSVNRK